MPALVRVLVLVHACDQPRALRHALGGVTCFHMQMQLVRNATVAGFHARIGRSDQSVLRYSAAWVSYRSDFGRGGEGTHLGVFQMSSEKKDRNDWGKGRQASKHQ